MIAVLAAIMAAAPSATELTVYNQGFGLVKETRQVNLVQGRQTVSVEDVAAMIDPSSVSVQSLSDKGSLEVLEQNYQYDLISPIAILNKSVGQRVRFVRTVGNGRETLEGTLISSPTSIVGQPDGGNQFTYNGMVIRTDDGRIVLNPSGEIEVASVPAGLISKPTLLWDINSAKAGNNTLELSYITNGISWNSDYVLTLDPTNSATLKGWVTLNNQSGATFENAKLKLLAGDVNQVPRGLAGGGFGGARAAFDMAAKAESFQEESLFEYHLYTLQRPATVRNKETKQLSLLESPKLTFTKEIIVDAVQAFGRYYPSEGEIGIGNIKPQVRVEFLNNQANGLGIPLPKGRMRIYQKDASGSVQLLGEDQIDHTPKNEKLSLVVGRSFDIVSDRKRTDFKRISANVVQETFEIQVRNRKETPERVIVLERNYSDWSVLAKSQDFEKADANTLRFTLDLKPNEVKTITYTIQSRWW